MYAYPFRRRLTCRRHGVRRPHGYRWRHRRGQRHGSVLGRRMSTIYAHTNKRRAYPFQCRGRPRRWGYRASRRSKKTRWSHDEPLFSLCVHRRQRRAAYLACVDLCDGHRQRYKIGGEGVVVVVVVGGKRKAEKRSVYIPTTISHGDYLQPEQARTGSGGRHHAQNDLVGASTQGSRLG